MITKEQITAIVSDKLRDTTTFIVDVLVKTGNNIIVFIDDEKGVTIDFCVQLSRAIEESLNREEEDFSLEISSAGVGNPFKVRQQYQKAIGKNIDVVLTDGRKISGVLCNVADNGITISKRVSRKKKPVCDAENFSNEDIYQQIAWDSIKRASEVINLK